MSFRVLLGGVGGQGTILAAHVLADVAMRTVADVKVSEIHGMAQRGGSVTTVVTFGDEVDSMVSGPGASDALVSFEILEALRNIDQIEEGGSIIVNDEVIKPSSVLRGKEQLPQGACEELLDHGAILVPAEAIAREAGNAKTSNVVLLGALSQRLPFPTDDWEAVILDHVPPKTREVNLKAFEAGRAFAREHEGGR